MWLRRILTGCVVWAWGAVAFGATHEVSVISFRFQPEVLTVQQGDTVVWRNSGGAHNVTADDSTFGNGPASSASWVYSETFDRVGEHRYYCEPHGGPGGLGMSGVIRVQGSTPTFAINYGISGTWYNPATSGQGFFVEVVPSLNLLVFSWFTWSNTTPGVHDWLTGVGPISGDQAAIDLQRSNGGRFNDPTTVTTGSVGSATVKFTDCNTGTVTFQRSDNATSGTIPIQRLTVTPAACTSPTSQ